MGSERVNCSACTPGFFATTKSTQCVECPRGRVSQHASGGCDQCGLGTFAAQLEDRMYCASCAPGKFAGAINTAECEPCESAKYTPRNGSSSCSVCTNRSWTLGETGATACVPCKLN